MFTTKTSAIRRSPTLSPRSKHYKRWLLAASLCGSLELNSPLHAADLYWDADGAGTAATGGTGTWTTANTWRTGSGTGTLGTWANSNNAFFEGTAGVVSIGATAVTTTGTFFNVTGYTLQTDAVTTTRIHTGNITLGSGVNLNLMEAAATTARAFSIAGNVSGGTSLTIQGAQTSGVASRVNLSQASTTISTPIIINQTGAGLAGIVSTAVGNQITNTITNNSNGMTILGATSGFTLSLSSAAIISGSQGLMFAAGGSGGAGVITLNSQSTYLGPTQLNAANTGIIKLGVSNALPIGTNVTMGFSSGNGGVLDLNNFNQEIASLTNGVGGGSITNSATVAGTGTLTVSGSTSPAAFTLPITDGATAKTAITRSGTGTLTLGTAARTYSGSTTISSGRILASGVTAFSPNSVHNVGASGTLELGGNSNSVGGLSGTGIVEGTSGTPILTIAGTTGSQSFGGTIQNTAGTLALAKSGGATQIFTTPQTYGGGTAITGGTLLINNTTGSGTGTGNITITGGTFGGSGTASGTVALNANALVSPGASVGLVSAFNTGASTWANTASYNFDVTNATAAAGIGFDTYSITGGLDLSALTVGGFTVNVFGRDGAGSLAAVTGFSSSNPYTWTLATASGGITGFNAANFTINATPTNFTTANPIGSGTFSIAATGNNLNLLFTPGGYTPKSIVWTNGSTDGLWNSSSVNWLQPPATAFTNTDNVTFDGTVAGTVTVDAGGVSPGSVNVSGANNYTIQGGSINGSTTLTKTGAGVLTLSPTSGNAYTGGTNLNGGTIAITNDSALGNATAPLAFNGGTLRTDAAVTSSRSITVAAGGATINSNGNDSVLTPGSAIALTGSFTKSGTGNLELRTNGFSGAGVVNVTGGQLTLGDSTSPASAPTTFLGNGTNALIVNGAALRIAAGATGTLASAGNNLAGNSTVTLFQTSGTAGALNYTLGGPTTLSGTLNINAAGNNVIAGNSTSRLTLGAVTLTGNTTYQVTASGPSANVTASTLTLGAINDGGFQTTFLGQGSGTQLPGAGIFLNTAAAAATGSWVIGNAGGTGGVIVSLGATGSQAQSALPSGNITVNPYGQLQFFQGTTATFGNSSQTITLSGIGAQLADLSAGTAGALLYNPTSPNSNTVTFQGNMAIATGGAVVSVTNNGGNNKLVIGGTGTFTGTLSKQGSGEIVFNGAASGAGGTLISNGKISTGAAGGIGTGDLTFSQSTTNNTRVDLASATQSVGNLSTVWNAPAQVAATTITQRLDLTNTVLTVNQTTNATFGDYPTPPANVTGTGTITGTGSLVKQGPARLTLSGVSTYTGTTTVSQGTLALAQGGQLGVTDVSVAGGATLATTYTAAGPIAGGNSLSLASGAALNLGDGSANTLSFTGGASALGGGTLTFDFLSNTSFDVLALGSTTLSGTNAIAFNGTPTLAVGTYSLITGTFNTGSFFTGPASLGGFNLAYNNSGTALELVVTPGGGGAVVLGAAAANSGAFGNLLVGATASTTVTLTNSGTAATTSIAANGSLPGFTLGAPVSGTVAGSGGTTTATVTVDTSTAGVKGGNLTYTANPGAVTSTPTIVLSANVGNSSFGTLMSAATPTAYTTPANGLSSSGTGTAISGNPAALNSTATVLLYTNSTGSDTAVNMTWRTRTAAETSNQEPLQGGVGFGTLAGGGFLISDVVDLTGMKNNPLGPNPTQTDVFALQINYNDALMQGGEMASIIGGGLFLASLNGSSWVNATDLNVAPDVLGTVNNYSNDFDGPGGNNAGSWANFVAQYGVNAGNLNQFIGSWGVDPTSNQAWAILDHNSEFAVVPEPSTLVLGGLALLGFAGAGLRRRRLAQA